MKTFLFYDLETTGLNPAFDQILQFAAIRTDTALNEIDRHNIIIKLRPDVVCSPRAMLTHQIPLSSLTQGICEYEAIQQIHSFVNEFNSISLGYNTLGFDDEFLRFSFFRNLLPPYTHQYQNGCHRMDLFPITIMYWLYKRNVLDWPEINGKPTLKLEHINNANHLAEGQAHDAMVDVMATVALARRLKKENEMWHYLSDNFIKQIESTRIHKLPEVFQSTSGSHRYGIMVSSEFGFEQQYQSPVLSIGNSIPYQNQTLWLRLDLPELQETAADTVEDSTWVIRKRLGEPGMILPPLKRYTDSVGKERSRMAQENIQWLQSHHNILQEIICFHQKFTYPEIPDLDEDAALYQMGFLSPKEEAVCQKFHNASLDEKIKHIDLFENAELKTLARRILCRNYNDRLPQLKTDDFKTYISRVNAKQEKDILLDYKGHKRMTPLTALAEILHIKQEEAPDEKQLEILNSLEAYLKNNFK